MRRLLLFVVLALSVVIYQNCGESKPPLQVASTPSPESDLGDNILGQDIGSIERIYYSNSGGLLGIQASLSIYFDPVPNVWGSRTNLRGGSEIMCTQMMHNLTALEIESLKMALSGARLKSIPGSDMVVADCPTASLSLDTTDGKRITYQFDAGFCNAALNPKTVIEDTGGLQQILEDLITKYGCNDPVM